MGLTRKTILKRLEHINLSGWHALKDVDQGLGFFEDDVRNSPFPDAKIEGCLSILIYKLWGVPSLEVSLDEALEVAPAAGKEYLKPAYQRHQDIWLNKMLSLMLICSLQENISDLVRFSNWFRIKKLQPVGTREQMAHQPILYYVADMYRKEKFENFELLQECQAHFRVKDPPP